MTHLQLLLYALYNIPKIVIVDDIGLTKEQLSKLKNIKGLLPRDKQKNKKDSDKDNSGKENYDKRNDSGKGGILEFPKDFIHQNTPTKNHSQNEPLQPQDIASNGKNNPSKPLSGSESPGLSKPYNNSNNLEGYTNNHRDPLAFPTTIDDEEKDLVRQEKENMVDANRARSAFIDLKINESQQREDQIERKIYELESNLNAIEQKLNDRKNEQEQINSNLMSLKNRKNNLIKNKRKAEMEKDKLEAALRLINNEIAHLNKQLDDLKSKAITAKDEKDVYANRLRDHENSLNKISKEVIEEEIKSAEYQKEVVSLDNLFTSLKNQIDDFSAKKSREETNQNKLEMEKERINRSSMNYI